MLASVDRRRELTWTTQWPNFKKSNNKNGIYGKKAFGPPRYSYPTKGFIFTSFYALVVLVFTNEGKYVNLMSVTHWPDSVIQMYDFEKFL